MVRPVSSSSCENINECAYQNGGCEEICVDTVGSYYCRCPPGLELSDDGKTCNDIKECNERSRCPFDTKCIETHGGYHCVNQQVVPQPLIGEANLQSSNKFTDNTLILSAVLSAACALIVCGIVVAIHNKWRSRHSRRRVDMRVHRTDEDYPTTSQKTIIATITT